MVRTRRACMYGPAVRCKRFRRSWRCGLASMYLFNPGLEANQGQLEARIVEGRRPQSSHWSTKTVCAVIGWGSLVSCLRNCGAYL